MALPPIFKKIETVFSALKEHQGDTTIHHSLSDSVSSESSITAASSKAVKTLQDSKVDAASAARASLISEKRQLLERGASETFYTAPGDGVITFHHVNTLVESVILLHPWGMLQNTRTKEQSASNGFSNTGFSVQVQCREGDKIRLAYGNFTPEAQEDFLLFNNLEGAQG